MTPLSPKYGEKIDLAARAAWLYYVAGNTQHEIAQKLQISRPAAQRLVALALESGIVKVRVHHGVGSCLEIANAIKGRYNLAHCEVVPSDGDSRDQILRKIAVAGANVMESYFGRTDPTIIAVSSGRTIKAVIDELTPLSRPQHRLVSLVGAIAHDGSSNPYDVALRAAEKSGSKYFLLPAPLLADSTDERKQWCNHRLYRVVEALAQRADVAFVGIGEIGINCPLHCDGFITETEATELVRAGAVGETLGWTFDRDGQPVTRGIQDRVTSISLRRPSKKPVIAFAAAEHKAGAVLGALRGQWINGLVTDEGCAKRILDLAIESERKEQFAKQS
jgi:DNA-binding transcriptional regulator LsrR (DeoR family)